MSVALGMPASWKRAFAAKGYTDWNQELQGILGHDADQVRIHFTLIMQSFFLLVLPTAIATVTFESVSFVGSHYGRGADHTRYDPTNTIVFPGDDVVAP